MRFNIFAVAPIRFATLVSVCLLTFGNSAVFAQDKKLANASGYPPGLTVVSLKEAETLFYEVATDSKIPFDYPDGCYAKAEDADIFLEHKGIIAGKAFVEGQIYHRSHWGPSFWTFHVAVLVLVNQTGTALPYVIDPFLSHGLVTYTDWLSLVKQDPRTTITKSYFTSRFVYGPSERNINLNHYRNADLKDMTTVLQQIRSYLAGQ